jgi:hypothetical protein
MYLPCYVLSCYCYNVLPCVAPLLWPPKVHFKPFFKIVLKVCILVKSVFHLCNVHWICIHDIMSHICCNCNKIIHPITNFKVSNISYHGCLWESIIHIISCKLMLKRTSIDILSWLKPITTLNGGCNLSLCKN